VRLGESMGQALARSVSGRLVPGCRIVVTWLDKGRLVGSAGGVLLLAPPGSKDVRRVRLIDAASISLVDRCP